MLEANYAIQNNSDGTHSDYYFAEDLAETGMNASRYFFCLRQPASYIATGQSRKSSLR